MTASFRSSITKHSLMLIIWTLLCAGLYFTSLYSYILFHIVAESFSFIIAFALFLIAWNTRHLTKNNYVLFLGIALLFTGFIDFVHTLTYKGTGIFIGFDANLPTQLWIGARYLQSLSFLAAPWFIDRKLNPAAVFAWYLFVTLLLLAAVFSGTLFPDCFIEGKGLTSFKIISEYLICLILIGSFVLLFNRREKFDPLILQYIAWSILCSIVAELAFTFYINVFGVSNLIGHFFKIFSYYLIYKAIIVTGLENPYSLIFHDLQKNKEEMQIIMDASPIMIFYKDCENRMIRVNKALAEVTGLPKEAIEGKTVLEIAPNQTKDYWEDDKEVIASGTAKFGIIEPIETTTGIKWLQLDKIPYRDKEGRIIGIIGFAVDITERKQMEEELRVSEQQFKTLAEVSPSGIWQTDYRGSYTYVSARWSEITGISSQDATGCGWTEGIHPEDKERIVHEWAREAQTAATYRSEFRFVKSAGEVIWVLCIARLIEDAVDDRKSWVGTITDISTLKRTEALLSTALTEKETLLREVHHRVKNNLAAIIGLMDMQRRILDDPQGRDALTDLSGRIRSMSLVHEMLYRADSLTRINFQEYIQDLGDLLRTSLCAPHITCRVDAQGMAIPLNLAVPCGMIINELITNALKYAFPGGKPRPGNDICLIRVTMRHNCDTYTFSVADNGIGMPPGFDWTKNRTLGMTLIRMLGQHQLGGSYELDQTGGARWTLTFTARKETNMTKST